MKVAPHHLANIRTMFADNPSLAGNLQKLNDNGIKYGIYGSAVIHLITSRRIYSDIDALVYRADFPKLTQIFPTSTTVRKNKSCFIYLESQHELEIACGMLPGIEGHRYVFDLTGLAVQNMWSVKVDGVVMKLMNPFDTILMKAMLQNYRMDVNCSGQMSWHQGKHDLEDIKNILRFVNLDKAYVRARIKEVNPNARLLNCLRRFNIVG